MSSLVDAIQLLEDIFINTSFFSTFMVPQMIIIVATLLFITREVNDWKKLAFPVMIGWNVFGMYINPILLAGAGVILILDSLSTEVIGKAISIAGDKLRFINKDARITYRQNRLIQSEGRKIESFNKVLSHLKKKEHVPEDVLKTGLKSFTHEDSGKLMTSKLKRTLNEKEDNIIKGKLYNELKAKIFNLESKLSLGLISQPEFEKLLKKFKNQEDLIKEKLKHRGEGKF